MGEKRVLVVRFGVAVATVIGFIASRSIAAITVAVFLYDSTRRFHRPPAFGSVVLGFYGLFFAPILPVLGHTYADTALPRLLGAERDDGLPTEQTRLDQI